MLFAQDADEAVFRHYNDTIFVRFRKRDLDIKNIDALAAVLIEAGADGAAFAAFLPEGLGRVAAIGRAAEAEVVWGPDVHAWRGDVLGRRARGGHFRNADREAIMDRS